MFLLQQQHLIELIRGQKIEEALLYAGEYLAERGEQTFIIVGSVVAAVRGTLIRKRHISGFIV